MLAKVYSAGRVTLLPRTTFLHINGALIGVGYNDDHNGLGNFFTAMTNIAIIIALMIKAVEVSKVTRCSYSISQIHDFRSN